MVSIGDTSLSAFLKEEFSGYNFKDKRLLKRFLWIMEDLSKRLTSCVKRFSKDPLSMRQSYDFFKNPKIKSEGLFKAHAEQTAERIKSLEEKTVLVIQDGMRLNFTNHEAKTDIGRIALSHSKDQYGLIQHSSLCVTLDNEPLGILDAQFFDYDQIDTTIKREKRPIHEKANACWIKAFEKAHSLIGSKKRFITVADREGDFFEFLHAMTFKNADFVVRANTKRKIGQAVKPSEISLHDVFEESPCLGTLTLDIQNVETRHLEEVTLALKAATVTLPVPKKLITLLGKEAYQPITLQAIQAKNETYQWILLTSLECNTLQQAEHIVHIYKARWHIEDFHKVLKTGYQVDEIFLHSSVHAIKNLLVLANISALRLYWLIYKGRVAPEIKADQLFKEFEWKSAYVYLREPIPSQVPSLQEVIFKIATMGGYKSKKNQAPPGIKTMWMGFSALAIAAETLNNFINLSTKT